MAEARHQDGAEDCPNVSTPRRRDSTGHSDRNKPDHLHVSQGALSSIKSAFKRTSPRARSQTENSRERRRPEITILSAEPLTPTSWFPASGGFPSPAFTTQPVWSENILNSAQLPPSYEQVIKEKTQEQVTTPTPFPRRSYTTTTSTQTDRLEENATSPDSNTPLQLIQQHRRGVSTKQPNKPPRPLLPSKPKITQTSPKELCSDKEDEIATQSCSTAKNCSNPGTAVLPVTTDLTPTQPPVPRPRATPVPQPRATVKQIPTNQVNVPPLIKLHDSWNVGLVTPIVDSNVQTSNYLNEFLDVYISEPQYELSNPVNIQGKKTGQSAENHSANMTALHSDRNIRAKIQAFESVLGAENEENDETTTPLPRPRKAQPKPPVLAPKPSIAPRPSMKKPKEEEFPQDNNLNDVILPPTPAPRPQLFKKPLDTKYESDFQLPLRPIPIPPSRPSLIKVKNVTSQDEEVAFKGLPSPLKPSIDLLNFNNHNSTALLPDTTSTESIHTNDYVDAAIRGFSYMAPNVQGVTRRPTVIRVPSKTEKYLEEMTDVPPPLPVQKAVGGLSTPAKPSRKDSFSLPSEISLPPRPIGGKILPARPPPAKTNPGRPPPPQKNGSVRRPSDNIQQEVSLKVQQPHSQQQNRRGSRKGPALPPRPNPGHHLYNKYTLGIPHGIAQFNYNGTDIGELSFQRNEVLVLLEQLDNKTFECQAGNAKGTVQASNMKIITPLTNLPYNPQPQQKNSPSQRFSGMVENTGSFQVQALYDFTPEGPGELGLKAGDVVSNVEQLDSDWYMGTCRNITGFFPVNYAKPLNKPITPVPTFISETKPKPTPEPISGPRCIARFDFEGEHSDELSFSEGDVIQLLDYAEDEWASGRVNGKVGIFPLNFVEVIVDLPPAPVQKSASNKIALPGMAGLTNTQKSYKANEPEGVEWAVALYDFTAETEDDLPFQQGDRILVTAHIDDEWWSGKLNGREGVFPKAFVEVATDGWK
ncbi:SH3 domain-containing protein 19 isoform X3 [Paramisgurnus dabryanus]|uniref:SH3 domain-containing protein 19 isoform X3 n=1 Tax=Paramisgurnus dabryanus TaxID=90735 RepID=UPI003CCF90B0